MKRVLLLFVLFPFAAFAQLSGNYVVGSSQAAPFNTLTNAVARINSVGQSGPVAFLLDNTSFTTATGETFPITINEISGSSPTNTFTIKPNTGKTVLVRADNPNGYTVVQAVIKLNGADNIFINGSNNNTTSKDLTLSNTNNLTYGKRSVIWLANTAALTNGANGNGFSNVILQQSTTAGALSMGIYAAGYFMDDNVATGPNSNNTVTNVTFTKVGQGVYVNGSATAAQQSINWMVTGSTFGSAVDATKGFAGVYFNNVKTYTISKNSMDGFLKPSYDYNPTLAAIYTAGISSDGLIFNNKIDNVKETVGGAATGIFLTGNNTSVYNNFINNVRANGNGGLANNGYGIYLNSGTGVTIYHNTVNLAQNQASGFSAPLYINGGSTLNVRNNIFVNSQTSGAARYAVYSAVANTAFTNTDFNDYVSSQYVGYLASNQTTLANWKTATGKDAASVSITPNFTSATDLHIVADTSTTLDNLGTPIAAITNDIDLQTRSTTKPDLGADEFDAPKCGSSTTWNGTAWSSGVPTINVKAIINGNYNTNTANITACELAVNNGFILTINADQFVEVQNNITVTGNLFIMDKGSLIQNDDAATSTGNITVKRKTAAMKQYDYTYWSSPVVGALLGVTSSPAIYYSYSAAIDNYVPQTASTVMAAGTGYISRAPNNLNYSTPQYVEAVFTGVPNTGIINVPVVKGTGNSNLIGNPYPSAIDADAFLSNAANASLIGGTIYLWTHNTAISTQNAGNQVYNYARDDYAKYNVTGGVKTASAATSGGVTPTGKIASGQGFFVESLQPGTMNIVFNNSMRSKGVANNGNFFRENGNHVGVDNSAPVQKNRVWLNLSNTEGAYDEMLVGYISGATNDLDRAYDGKTFPAGNVVSLYSILGEDNLAIQGRALPFNDADVIPVGMYTEIAGTFTISVGDFDGFFQNQDVYLLDKMTNTFQNLKTGSYTFSSAIGTFNDRFELHFKNIYLQETNLDVKDYLQHSTLVIGSGKHVSIQTDGTIEALAIYDLTGKVLYTKNNIDATTYNTPDLNFQNPIIIAKVKMSGGIEINKKLILN